MNGRNVTDRVRSERQREPDQQPVFHDGSGRRRRWVTLVFVSVGVAMVATLGTLVLALTGTSPIPLPGFPDATRNADRNPGVTPAPSPTAPNGQVLTGASGTSTTAGQTATPTPTKKGNVPSHTPTHPRPTKTR